MPGHDIIVIGASAGGVEALVKLVGQFPADLPASIFMVLHIPAQSPSLLPDILSRSGRLEAVHPRNGESIAPGCIYIAPPDHHILVARGYVRVVRGPKENRHRPAIDPLFRSAALAYGRQVVGVVLTGALDDGTAGLYAIKQRGGIAIVQNPKEALYPSMPRSALEHVNIDYCLSLSDIGPRLERLAHQQAGEEGAYPVPEDMEEEVKYVEMNLDNAVFSTNERVGKPSAFSCPECGGVLWELQDQDLLRFRCRVGHAFSVESVEAAQVEQLEDALWTALKTLEENASLSRRMAKRASERGQKSLVRLYEERVRGAEQRARLIQQVFEKEKPVSIPEAAMGQASE